MCKNYEILVYFNSQILVYLIKCGQKLQKKIQSVCREIRFQKLSNYFQGYVKN
jgi:hypothetical protein